MKTLALVLALVLLAVPARACSTPYCLAVWDAIHESARRWPPPKPRAERPRRVRVFVTVWVR